MIICIAALADNGKSLILTTDKMVTNQCGGMSYEYEKSNISKILELSQKEIFV